VVRGGEISPLQRGFHESSKGLNARRFPGQRRADDDGVHRPISDLGNRVISSVHSARVK
jgi:hypothetical protein